MSLSQPSGAGGRGTRTPRTTTNYRRAKPHWNGSGREKRKSAGHDHDGRDEYNLDVDDEAVRDVL